jgi:gluconolactonase
LAITKSGIIYFTDPPYGLIDPHKREIDFQGVYKLNQSGEVELLIDSLSYPNGIAFSQDEKTIYIANSDPQKAVWYSYSVNSDGMLKNGKVFYDATSEVKKGESGLPDGLKVHKNGTIFATGPGGVFLFSPKGEKLGIVRTSKATANCALDKEHSYLYLTTTDRLLRLKLK